MYLRFSLILGLLTLSGCATLTDEECVAADWRAIGVGDGRNGRLPDYIAQHRKACESAGIIPDAKAWSEGRALGLPSYCTPDRAYRLGRSGRHVAPVCPAGAEPALEAANSHGRTYFGLTREISDLRSEIRSLQSEMSNLPKEDPGRLTLLSRISALRLEISLVETRRLRYARWP